MAGALEQLDSAVRLVEVSDGVEPSVLRSLIDRLEGKFAQVVHQATRRGDHELSGRSPVSWVASTCGMSPTSASDRLCVGAQLEQMPRVEGALRSGEIGYQSAAIICHFRDRLSEPLRHLCDEEQWIGHAKEYSVKTLRWLEAAVRYRLDPDSFDREMEEDYEQRHLYISESRGMFHVSGVLDREGGAALETAIQALAKPLGAADKRTPKQRRADALVEMVKHAMTQGTMPRRNRVRPHITVTTTIAGLKRELGANAPELQNGLPLSGKTVQRLACDGMLSRVVTADSVVIDVGRATASVSPAQWRALKARHRTCAFPACDRPINWTSPHHIEFRCHGGPTNLRNLLPLCHTHHRQVHEGGWQIVKAGAGYKFIGGGRSPTELLAA